MLARQRPNRHSPPRQSVFTPQGAPGGALQAALAQAFVEHWAFAEQAAHLPITQRPLTHAASAAQVAPIAARQSSVEQSRQNCPTGSHVGVEVPWHAWSFVQGTWTITPLVVVTPGPVVTDICGFGEPPAPPHWRRSVQGSGANRHPGVAAVSASAKRAATRAPRWARGEGIEHRGSRALRAGQSRGRDPVERAHHRARRAGQRSARTERASRSAPGETGRQGGRRIAKRREEKRREQKSSARSSYALGPAREATRDAKGACAADQVVDRWGGRRGRRG